MVIDDAETPMGTTNTYIGVSSTFDACHQQGIHIPIDERYIPSSLLEWGYVPTTLETIVFETVHSKYVDRKLENENIIHEVSSSSNIPTISSSVTTTDMTRHVYTILPATGCDNDNLESILTTEQYTRACTFTTATTSATIYNRNCSNIHNIGIETCFQWKPDDIVTRSVLGTKNGTDERYRIRINVEIGQEPKCVRSATTDETIDDTDTATAALRIWHIMNPVRVSIEKNLDSSSQMMTPESIKSGGLDSRTITKLLGPILHSESIRSFPTQQAPTMKQFENILLEHDSNNAEMIALPGNVTITTSQICKLDDDRDEIYQIDVGYMSSPQQDQCTNTTPNQKYTVVSYQIPSECNMNHDLSLTHASTKIFDLIARNS
jgi:hypothetical protein